MSSQLLSTPATHSSSLVSLADRAWNAATEVAFKVGSSKWLCDVAENMVTQYLVLVFEMLSVLNRSSSTLKNISQGQLTIRTSTQTYVFPDPGMELRQTNSSPHLKASLTVLNPTFWMRICLTSDMGFAEAFMFGDIEVDNLINVFEIFVLNRTALSSMSSWLSKLFGSISGKITNSRFLGSLANTRSNISSHYDLSNEMYMGFLSKDMTYSSAIFRDLDGDLADPLCPSISPSEHADSDVASTDTKLSGHDYYDSTKTDDNDPLYEGQMRKYDHLIKKADIRPGHRILEIGSGWGAFAIRIAQTIPGTTIDTITLSSRQLELAEARIKEAGLQDRIRIYLMDYRSLPSEWEGAFDRMVSVEMMEHVGYHFFDVYWRQTSWALNKDTGAGVVQCITLPEARYETYIREIDFMRKWVITEKTPRNTLDCVRSWVQDPSLNAQYSVLSPEDHDRYPSQSLARLASSHFFEVEK
ncbi:hypothetical protein EIP91_007748 [Steccherinum ochraceum]|uniref:Cyclopropane-fatty-acyl-phospholipid synthase n=1 Tax=Steccherinum ochraceum TaxID=92696 RepID=A0A4R0RLH4_9APHY|nr:hypothetical protein EIP91_007748 [Steccherinum ochraceum]